MPRLENPSAHIYLYNNQYIDIRTFMHFVIYLCLYIIQSCIIQSCIGTSFVLGTTWKTWHVFKDLARHRSESELQHAKPSWTRSLVEHATVVCQLSLEFEVISLISDKCVNTFVNFARFVWWNCTHELRSLFLNLRFSASGQPLHLRTQRCGESSSTLDDIQVFKPRHLCWRTFGF